MQRKQLKPLQTNGDINVFRERFENNLYYHIGQAVQTASLTDGYMALAYSVRDYLVDRWRKTVNTYYETNPKFIYYLSAEYLLGRQLAQNMLYTDTKELAKEALSDFNSNFEEVIDQDIEPGLGNGGLGRLAACFLDSMATLDIPSVGYGIRYEFGIFRQSFKNGWQVESPDEWLYLGYPWEFAQPDDMVEVQFNGYTEHYQREDGEWCIRWVGGQKVMGEPYHTMVPGYKTGTVNMLRLWGARATNEFDFQLFDNGDYARAVEQKTHSENISKVLYPNDNMPQGQELRLKQQYFFVACSLNDIIRRFHIRNDDWNLFPEKVVIQLNDTHPVIGIPELMRLLVDEYHLPWDQAWSITSRTFAYTCHTLMPEALERWPVSLVERLLPRHMEIIYEINARFLKEVEARFPNDHGRLERMSIIEEGYDQRVRMANLASVGSFSINGVAQLHSDLLKGRVLHDFYEMWPEKFNNKTNGVTPRRFVKMANPGLSDLITSKIGDDWIKHLEQLEKLEDYVDDADFRQAWDQVKQANKQRLAEHILKHEKIQVNPNSMFDIMVKRLHEYKRQHLKMLHIVTLYNRLKANPGLDIVPRTFIFGAKAAPGYFMAKRIIKVINAIGNVINNDPDINDRLKVAFISNFNVTVAQKIYPAADLSEQISMAGKEASGTGNMKFALNGALTIGTLDGANVEIREHVGEENFFLFGLTTEEVFATKERGYDPMWYYHNNHELRQAIDQIASGYFTNGDQDVVKPVVNSMRYHDEFLSFADYQAYIEAQDRVDEAYRDRERWTRMSILNVARCGFFSSDRTIKEYCDDIWKITPVPVRPRGER
ncbi:MAG: glycogen/starch/alpha-glucan phosphorylase [Anaerolineae bacterium]|nr:glycogen/starch/alpha-glucan phosphorylase [Anaerolineae bacterium]MCB0177300.1 glycogen/starch/alpha-glucan phosphorylase [Anaerolineae bacterium]MCB9079957.1 glycogen/starch/alpha-glucan phosphorylase [Anaerolineaceae bacterium]MCB9108970.1 glycogen/starch/alpha-glucan phosphorylase [Anaerolineales bacterium]